MDENRVPLSQLFSAVAQTVDERKDYLNGLDGSSGNTGDNAAYNWQVVAEAAAQAEAVNPDAGFVLAAAAQALDEQGRGKTAAMYARGLRQAAAQFQGQQGMTLNDFQPLVESMTSGMQRGSKRVGHGASPADAFGSAVQGFSQAREQGLDDQQAALAGVMQSTGGGSMGELLPMILGGLLASGLGGQPSGSGGAAADPMGGLLGALLGGMLGGGATPSQPQGQPPDLGSILGGMLGGGATPAQSQDQPPDLGSILGGLLGGSAPQPAQDDSDDTLLGDLSQGQIPPLSSSSPGSSDDDAVVLGGLSSGGQAASSGDDQVLLGGLSGAAPAQGSGQPDLSSILGALLGGQGMAASGQGGAGGDAGSAAGSVVLEGLLRGLSGGR